MKKPKTALAPIEPSIALTVVPKAQIPISAQTLASQLLESGSSIEGFVRLHNLVAILESAKAILKDPAILQIEGKQCVILGAKVTAKRNPCRWDYHGDTRLAKLELEATQHKKLLQSLTSQLADTGTGEIYQPATKIEGGETISCEF